MRTRVQIFAILTLLSASVTGHAIDVTQNTSSSELVNALTGGSSGMVVTYSELEYRAIGGSVSTGTYVNLAGTYGIGDGVVMSTGDVSRYGDGTSTSINYSTIYGVPATPNRRELLDPITGAYDHFDVSELDLVFDLLPGYDTIEFDLVFGSEEFPEYVHSMFNDGFGIYLNGTNIAFVGGLPVNISHPDVRAIPGTELDGILAPNDNPIIHFSAKLSNGATNNSLSIILADTSDGALDTTVYLSGLTGAEAVPEPGSIACLAFGLAAAGTRLVSRRRR